LPFVKAQMEDFIRNKSFGSSDTAAITEEDPFAGLTPK